MALAHTIGNKVEAAYQRGNLLEKRARLMETWASFIGKSHGSAIRHTDQAKYDKVVFA
jgi:muramidase (phage lysozyme)